MKTHMKEEYMTPQAETVLLTGEQRLMSGSPLNGNTENFDITDGLW